MIRVKKMLVLKENPALAVGIGLPILIVILFSLAMVVPTWFTSPPQYDALFTTNASSGYIRGSLTREITLMVVDGRLKVSDHFTKDQEFKPNVHLYLFEAKNGRTREISIPPLSRPVTEDYTQHEIAMPEIASWQIDSSITSPDGYQFHDGSNIDFDDGIWPFFSPRAASNRLILSKDGREVKIMVPDRSIYTINNDAHFIGWVIDRNGK